MMCHESAHNALAALVIPVLLLAALSDAPLVVVELAMLDDTPLDEGMFDTPGRLMADAAVASA
jgi:hypothetical protein